MSEQQRIITSNKTRGGVSFDIVHHLEGPKEGQIIAEIPVAHRFTVDAPKVRAFDEAAKQVQPLLDREQIGKAVGILRDVE